MIRLTAYQTYRAPKHHGDVLASPDWPEQSGLLADNRQSLSTWSLRIADLSWPAYQQQARQQLIALATQYTSRYRDVSFATKRQVGEGRVAREPGGNESASSNSDTAEALPCIVMSGHQPTLFHPGVWFKNFALDHVGRTARMQYPGAVAINLVIDNDVASAPSIRVPVWEQGELRQEAVPFDTASGGVPYEQSRIKDRALFETFGKRVADTIEPFVRTPLVERLWTHAIRAAGNCENSSCVIAHARHALEGELGLETLELPLSYACRTESFALFALAIFASANSFRGFYNTSLAEYRLAHGIRSTAHPVPPLGADPEWTETPFWIYGDDQPQRRSAWVRRNADGTLEISNRAGKSVMLTQPVGSRAAADELLSVMSNTWKLRPKALVTTMYARMVLSDLFIHGIGGAKYDQLGDQIASQFFGVTPPRMLVVSATLHLPVMHQIPQFRSVKQVRQRLRDLRFNPERLADEWTLPSELLQQKQALLNSMPPRGERRAWHQSLQLLNARLTALLADAKVELEAELRDSIRAQATTAMLRSREYSFCLFDEERLQAAFRSSLPT